MKHFSYFVTPPCTVLWLLKKFHSHASSNGQCTITTRKFSLPFSQIPLIYLPSISSTLSRVVFLIENPRVLSAFHPLFLPYFHNPFLLIIFSFIERIAFPPLSSPPKYDTSPSCWKPKKSSRELKTEASVPQLTSNTQFVVEMRCRAYVTIECC